jgi:hypothetical protein
MNNTMHLFKSIVKSIGVKRQYSQIPQKQKFFEVLNDINKSKDIIENITIVKWNTGYQNGNTIMFNFTNESNTYIGEILIRNIDNTDNTDNIDNEYLKVKSIEFAKKN